MLLTHQPGFLPPKVDAAPTTMKVDPQNSTAYLNDALNINVTVTDVTNMVGWQITELYYLNSILNCTSATEGPFLTSLGGTFPIFDILNNFNSTHGRVRAASVLLGSGNSANGTGAVATISFIANATGTTPITLGNTILKDSQNQDIPHTTISGNATVTLAPEHVVDVYTQRDGTGANKSSDAFAPGETIFINASLKHQGAPVPGIIVQFITYDPHGTPTARTAVTDQDGIASINTTIPSNPIFGTYATLATANVQGNDYNDTVTYQIGWIINFIKITPCNYTGTPQTQFANGTLAYYNITLENISINHKQLFLLIDATDGFGWTVAEESITNTVPSGKTTMLMGFRIPPWTHSGVGQTFVGAYNNPPWAGGYPYCPANYIPLSIVGG
jgi:hypothetical protein